MEVKRSRGEGGEGGNLALFLRALENSVKRAQAKVLQLNNSNTGSYLLVLLGPLFNSTGLPLSPRS